MTRRSVRWASATSMDGVLILILSLLQFGIAALRCKMKRGPVIFSGFVTEMAQESKAIAGWPDIGFGKPLRKTSRKQREPLR